MEQTEIEAIVEALVSVYNALPASWVGHVTSWIPVLSLLLAVGRYVVLRKWPDFAANPWVAAFDVLLDKVSINSRPLAEHVIVPKKERKP